MGRRGGGEGAAKDKASNIVKPAPGPARSPRSKVVRQTTAELVAEELRNRIINGEMAEGEPLYQERLAAELGVSRIPLREAMRQLEAEGLITLSSHRGGVVSILSPEEIKELFELRSCLETWLLSLAIPRMKDEDFAAINAIMQQMLPGEVERWGELNWQFHEALYAPSQRHQGIKILQRVHRNLDRYLRYQIAMTSDWKKANEEHAAIVEACRAGDVRRATALLDIHIMNAAGELLEVLASRRAKAS